MSIYYGGERDAQLSPGWTRGLLLVLLGALVVMRAPHLLWPGRFWAEEGSVYFVKCFTGPFWSVMTSVELGYYSLFNKLALLAAARLVPLPYAPSMCAAFAFAAMLLPAVLWLFSRKPFPCRPWLDGLFLALLLMVQPNQEVWMNTVNSQFYFCIATAVILITDSGRAPLPLLRLATLLMAGLTGVLSALLLPFFCAEYWATRSATRLRETLCLSVAAAIQLTFVCLSEGRETDLRLDLLPWVLLVKQWFLPLFGMRVADITAAFIMQHRLVGVLLPGLVALAPTVVAGLGHLLWSRRSAWYLFAGSLLVATLSFLKSAEAQHDGLAVTHLSSIGGGRYYFAPNLLLALSLLLPRRESARLPLPRMAKWFQAAGLAYAICAILVGTLDFVSSRRRHPFYFDGPSWDGEMRRRETSGTRILRIWPAPWVMELPLTQAAADVESLNDRDQDSATAEH